MMNRKQFVRTCAAALAGLGLTSTGLTGCAALPHTVTAGLSDNRLRIRKDEFEFLRRKKKAYRTFVLVRTPSKPFPVAVYRQPDGAFTAFYLRCTHRGCELQALPGVLVCPCHGSEFTPTGEVLSPPAERPLSPLHITSDDETLSVHM